MDDKMTEEFMGVVREIVASGNGSEALQLMHAIVGKPTPEAAWDCLTKFAQQARQRYEALGGAVGDEASDDALDVLDTAEALLARTPAPHLDALQWKLDYFSRELGVDGLLIEPFAVLRKDIHKFLQSRHD